MYWSIIDIQINDCRKYTGTNQCDIFFDLENGQ